MDQYHYQQAPPHSPQGWTSPPPPPPQPGLGTNQASPLISAQEKARTQGIVGRALLVAVSILLLLFGMIVALLSYVCLAHSCSKGAGGVLISTAPLGKVLTISQVASHVAPVTVPFVMGLCAYQLGAEWLQGSSKANRNQPSPLQLGLLMSICNAASFSAAFAYLKYIFGSNKDSQKRKLSSPPLLRQSFILLVILLVLSYVISVADAWFHASSVATAIPFSTSYNGQIDFGREINSTMCDEVANPTPATPSYLTGPTAQLTCGLLNDGSQSGLQSRPEGLRTISNSSAIHRVAFTQDQTAIIVPASLPPNVTYSAETIGLKTTCEGITRQCLEPTTIGGTVSYGSDASLNLQCRGPSIFNLTLPTSATFPESTLDDQGNRVVGYNISSNPFHVGALVESFAYYQGQQDTFIRNDSGWFVHGSAGAYDVVYCNVTVLNVVYTYASSQYTVTQATPTSLQDARHIITLGYETGLRPISTFVQGVGISTNETYEQAYALELSRQVVGLGAYLYQPKNLLSINTQFEVLGSSLNVLPLAILLGAMFIYGCTVLIVLFRAILTAISVPYTRLASLHFTDPLTTVHALYSPFNPASTWEPDTMDRFVQEGEGDRLYVGPLRTAIPGEFTFGVTRGSGAIG